MRYFLIFSATIICTGCARPNWYKYSFRLDDPKPVGPLTFENDTMAVYFRFSPFDVGFTIQNKSNDGIKINWDEVSLSIDGVAHRVVHKETGMVKINDLQPPTTIPPRSSLADIVVPTQSIRFSNIGGKPSPSYTGIWNNFNKGKVDDKILAQKGQKVVLFMPFRIADKYVAKSFYFTIDDIVVTKTKEF